SAYGLVELALDLSLVGIKAEDLAEVHGGRAKQLEPIGLGTGHRLFVRVDPAFAETLKANAGHKTSPRKALPFDVELLVVDINGPRRVLHQNVVSLPIAQKLGSARVAVIAGRIARHFFVENKTDDIVGTAIVE